MNSLELISTRETVCLKSMQMYVSLRQQILFEDNNYDVDDYNTNNLNDPIKNIVSYGNVYVLPYLNLKTKIT